MNSTFEISMHQLDDPDPDPDPDPEDEAELTEELISVAIAHIHTNAQNLGSAFQYAKRLLGFRVALQSGSDPIRESLRQVCELGVALFRRAGVGPNQTVTLSIGDVDIELPGGVTEHVSAPRWADAVGAAMTLRDPSALASLCSFDVRSFEGNYDTFHDVYAEAIMAFVRGQGGFAALLDQAATEASNATLIPESAQRVGLPTIAVARAVMLGQPHAFNQHLGEGLEWYRMLHSRPPWNTKPELVVPLRYLGLCALAHDRGLPCRVKSDYIPQWLVEP